MIIWIASYPRSGNTLLRTILKRCFGVDSHSLYDRIESETMVPVTGHVYHAMDRAAFVEKARASAEVYFVKTHELPPSEDDFALYIVRDGRAALESHRRYLQRIANRPTALEFLVLGAGPFACWSDHVLAWSRRRPDRTLVLRYEELAKPDDALLRRISAFAGRPLLRPFDLAFSELRAQAPDFFHIGHNGPGIAAVEQQCPRLFWTVNGVAMQQLGYSVPDKMPDPFSDAILAELRSAFTKTRNKALQEALQQAKEPVKSDSQTSQ